MTAEDYEDSLKILEDITSNAHETQEKVLKFRNGIFEMLSQWPNSGLLARSVTTTFFKTSSNFAKALCENHTNSIETVLYALIRNRACIMYCQLLSGLIHRDEVVSIGSCYISAVVRAIKFLEDHFIGKSCASTYRQVMLALGSTTQGCRNAMSLILNSDPKLADSIENICSSSKSWEGIIQKLWPKTKFIDAIATGGMSQFGTSLDFYSGGLPVVSPFYASSEALFGINLQPLNKPSHVSYTFLPNMAYFEFIPLEKQVQFNGPIETKQNDEDIEPVDLVNVKPGQCYEVVGTTSSGLYRYRVGDILMATGFHNSAPQFQFVERNNVILSIDADKTSEADLIKAVEEAKALLDPIGLLLTGFSSYADTSSIPGPYVVFWELKRKEGEDVKELDPETMVQCCSIMEESLSYI
ncbi:GH3 auxin-responsive promoter [Corchorus olitorius]|uniref:GH3 auxin-responsive promoter n=1 Tax=Corchorus olitorius TaxID=93759 RepID=A0A1R3GZJ4_9ROSI|nr:GH3 auxin-responsive promoter [Corchorus olitorius]